MLPSYSLQQLLFCRPDYDLMLFQQVIKMCFIFTVKQQLLASVVYFLFSILFHLQLCRSLQWKMGLIKMKDEIFTIILIQRILLLVTVKHGFNLNLWKVTHTSSHWLLDWRVNQRAANTTNIIAHWSVTTARSSPFISVMGYIYAARYKWPNSHVLPTTCTYQIFVVNV